MEHRSRSEITGSNGYHHVSLWIGPSTLAAIHTGKSRPLQSLLKTNNKEPSAINKLTRAGPVRLGRLGFDGDEQTYHEHGGPEKTVLQYNAGHYIRWREELANVPTTDKRKRDSLLGIGGFGENIAVKDSPVTPPMDETTMCIGDLVGIRKAGRGCYHAKIQVTGPRAPCYKLNHRFGVSDMAQRAQDKFRTGWMYSTQQEGDIEVGDELCLLERVLPEWPVARIQYYLYTEPRNFDMIKVILDSLGEKLVSDIRTTLQNRLRKGVENMNLRLLGDAYSPATPETFIQFRLKEKIKQTERISEFVFQRADKLSEVSSDFMSASPGSHIRLRFKLGAPLNGASNVQLIRPYSIISGNSNTFRLGIALADKSRGGSSFLHQDLQVGDIIEASDKFANTFPLQTTTAVDNHVFLAGGVGITAFLHHMQYCIDHGLRFQLHYMIRNESDHAFKALIERLVHSRRDAHHAKGAADLPVNGETVNGNTREPLAKVSVYVSSKSSRLDVPSLLSSVASSSSTHIFVCGSEKLSGAVTASAKALNIPSSRLHFEQFTVDGTGDPFIAELVQSKKKVQVGSNQTLLEALREAGLEAPSSCEAGNCGTCRVRVKCGQVEHRGTALSEDEKAGFGDREDGEMLACVSRGVGRIEIEL